MESNSELIFDPADPYPLFPVGSYLYSALKNHSEKVDDWLGFQISAIEEALVKSHKESDEQLWIGLSIQSLQTPYAEIRLIFSILDLEQGSRVIDLGSAYGRLGFVAGKHFPQIHFLGIEKVAERLREGERCIAPFSFPNVKFVVADLAAPGFELPEAEVYFLYDFGSKPAIRFVLDQIREHSKKSKIRVVGRGRASRDLIEQECPWLSQVVEPIHHSNFSIYQTA